MHAQRAVRSVDLLLSRYTSAAREAPPSTTAPTKPARSLGAVAPVSGQPGAARRRQRIVVIVDGLDEIPVPDVSWVPWVLPPSMQLVLSCHDGGDSGGGGCCCYRFACM